MRELARAYDPSANEARISAEVFLFHKYLLMQSCVGVFPESEVDHVVGGLFAALNERASGLDFSPERQQAMEQMWQLRAAQFDQPSRRIEPISSMKDPVLSTGNRRSSGSVRTCERSKILPTFGPGPMAHPKQQAVPSPRPSITWCRPSAK